MRPVLQLLPAFLWLWLVKRHAQRHAIHSRVVASDAGCGIGIIFPDAKEPTR